MDDEFIDIEWDEVAANVTLVSSPWSSLKTGDGVMEGRMHLPSTAVMDGDELNDPTGNYVLGSEWAMSLSNVWDEAFSTTQTLAGTVHQRSSAFANLVELEQLVDSHSGIVGSHSPPARSTSSCAGATTGQRTSCCC